jgi:hypothetical protein
MSSLLVFNRVYRLEIRFSHVGIFDPALWTIAPLTFFLVHLPHPPPLSKFKVQYIQTLCGLEGGGCWVVLETIFCRSLTLCFWPDSEPTKLLHHRKQKPRRRGGLRQINTCRKVPLHVNFFYIKTFGIAFYQSNLSTRTVLAIYRILVTYQRAIYCTELKPIFSNKMGHEYVYCIKSVIAWCL